MSSSTNLRLTAVKIGPVRDAGWLSWAEGGEFSVPESLVERLQPFLRADGRIVIEQAALICDVSSVEAVRTHSAYTDSPPVSTRLPFSYQLLPVWVRDLAARALGRLGRRRLARLPVPRWPLDLSADFLADLCAPPEDSRIDGRTPVMLTHDLDSAEGLNNAVKLFSDIEESVGARAAHYVVPCAWPVDEGLIEELRRRGHEIGVHGYDHSNRTPFAPDAERRARLAAAKPFAERYGARGYRAPSLLRTRALIEDLRPLYRYDSSIPTSGGLFPVPGNGCASARPFHIAGMLEIPVSMPRDGSLLFLGYSPNQILSTWRGAAEAVRASGGQINLLTHCENRFSGSAAMREVYRQFLEWLAATGNFVFALPREVAARHAGNA